MDETIMFPSPNWFQPSVMAVSTDEWLVYGGPSKSLCVLEPLPEDYKTIIKDQQGYKAHVVHRAHPERIICVDISPEWPEKRLVLTGSADGSVKQWCLEKPQNILRVKSTHSHEIHSNEKEEVIGVGYCKDGYAVTVGNFGVIVKWDLNSNVAKSFNHVLKNFKPTSMACSPHVHMHVAIGTKQGVLFVLDLNGSPRITYKVRAQDDEILKVSWCPQYEVAVRKALKEIEKKSTASVATQRMEKIRQEPTPPETMKELDERVKNSETTDQPLQINEKLEPVKDKVTDEQLDESGIGKTLPEDSFDCDESIVQEDDMFDIYKDHEADEFGHKKYQPVDILVKVPSEATKEDYLSECEKLKDEILKRKEQSETPIASLVDAMEKAKVDESKVEAPSPQQQQAGPSKPEGKIIKGEVESSVHIHKHLLATISRLGSIRIWSKTGKMVGCCAVPAGSVGSSKGGRGNKSSAATGCTTLLWCLPDSLVIADGKSQLLECNPLKIDCKNKLEWKVLHGVHKRGLCAIASSAARVQLPGQRPACALWSCAQDRVLARYCMRAAAAQPRHTCGGFLYMLDACPYDANKIAIAVGDGAVRVWQAESLTDEGTLAAGVTHAYWHNVQGKVLTVAWHPTRENYLAFATAEARVGVIDTSGAGEKPAKVLPPAGSGGVYSLCWATQNQLYAACAGELLLYNAAKPELAPTTINIEFEGEKWEVSEVQYSARGILLGSNHGAVALADHQHNVLAATFLYKKMIHSAVWHPQEISSASEPSSLKDLIAVCSLDKNYTITIVQCQEKEDGSKTLTTWKQLTGHKGVVLQVGWSPHQDELLLSTSQDATVRVWDVNSGECMSIFGGHAQTALGAVWAPQPALCGAVLSGGADCALRLWRPHHHPHHAYKEVKHEVNVVEKKRNRRDKREKKKTAEEDYEEDDKDDKAKPLDEDAEELAIASLDHRRRYKKKFMLPMIHKQTHPCDHRGPKKMLQRYLERNGRPVPWEVTGIDEYGLDFLKIFGTINEVNEVLDTEMERHQDMGCMEAWALVCIMRGYMDTCISYAAQHNLLDPFLLSIAPAVSFKYWKDATLLYLQQIDRLVAKREENILSESKTYGGAIFRKMAVLLSLHDVKGAVNTLVEGRLFKEAYLLSRTRYMDSLAEQTLQLWAQYCVGNSQFNLAAVCYIALGNLSAAVAALGKSSEEESLWLAAQLAAALGHNTFAGHMHEKRQLLRNQRQNQENLPALPTRAQLLMQEDSDDTASTDADDRHNVSDDKINAADVPTNEGNETTPQIETKELEDSVSTTKVAEETVPENSGKDNEASASNSAKGNLDIDNEGTNTAPVSTDEISENMNDHIETLNGQKENETVANSAKEILDVDKEKNTKEKTDLNEFIQTLPEKIQSMMLASYAPQKSLLSSTHKGEGDSSLNIDLYEHKTVKELDSKVLDVSGDKNATGDSDAINE